jgi:ABC-type transport system involved in multi-copper enzyme maturation permease subunit
VTAALRYEWVRVSTVRSTRLLLAFTLVLSALLGWLITNPHVALDENGNEIGTSIIDWWTAFSAPLTITAVLASVVASQAIGQEYRFGLIRLTLTAFPDRRQILVAKLVVVIGAAVVFALVSLLGSEIGVTVRGHPMPPADVTAPDSTFLLRGTVFVALWALASFALAGVTRQTAIGIAVPIISGLVVEQLLMALLTDRMEWLVRILPWSTAGRWAEAAGTEASGSPFGTALAVGWSALGVFAVWVLVFLAVETVAFLRRDA